MSTAFNPQADTTAEQALKVQELVISSFDPAMYSSASGSTSILVNEPVDKVYSASVKVDSSNTVTYFNQAQISVIDSKGVGQTSGISHATGLPVSDRGAISLPISSLATDDVVTVKYTVLQGLL